MLISDSSCRNNTGTITCMNCRKKNLSLLADLCLEELSLLEEKRYQVNYLPGEKIYNEGAWPVGLLCLNKGKVKVTRRGINGNEQIVALHKPVDFIGFKALMSERNYYDSAIALEETSICVINKKDFFDIIKQNSQLTFKLMQALASNWNNAEERLVNLTQKHMSARLADTLLMLEEIYGVDSQTGELNVSLKRSELAAMANMTTANAIRYLSAFAKDHIIEINQRMIRIKDFKTLTNISNR